MTEPAPETIYALCTPPGRGGVAVVRVSGPGAAGSFKKLAGVGKTSPPRRAVLRTLTDPVSRQIIDHALTLFFRSPASYTGEDVVEYHLHGGAAVIESLLTALSKMPGHRPAEPGEFTRRAFENGKMDLTAAEAVADLVNAQTELQKQQALSQMEGALSSLYDGWREQLIRALAHMEADIEFPEDDMPSGVTESLRPGLESLIRELDGHLNDNRRGEILREGVQIAVIGAPNAGKSSLVNALARRDAAIVSPLPGTTRDVIEVHLNLGGYPVILADTAGLRPEQIGEAGHDAVESEGIRRALKKAQEADIRLLVFDAAKEPDAATLALAGENSLIVWNKTDVCPSLVGRGCSSRARTGEGVSVPISAAAGTGLNELTAALIEKIKFLIGTRETPALTRRRHRVALEDCRLSLTRALSTPLPELAAEDMRLAVRALGRITGRVDVEDVLDVVFRDFCIGK